jgi:hypothetical protein
LRFLLVTNTENTGQSQAEKGRGGQLEAKGPA